MTAKKRAKLALKNNIHTRGKPTLQSKNSATKNGFRIHTTPAGGM
jgi:hypothetical protein